MTETKRGPGQPPKEWINKKTTFKVGVKNSAISKHGNEAIKKALKETANQLA